MWWHHWLASHKKNSWLHCCTSLQWYDISTLVVAMAMKDYIISLQKVFSPQQYFSFVQHFSSFFEHIFDRMCWFSSNSHWYCWAVKNCFEITILVHTLMKKHHFLGCCLCFKSQINFGHHTGLSKQDMWNKVV